MKGFSLTAWEIAATKRLHHQLPHRRDADKVKAIILLGTGWSVEQASEPLLLDERTLRRYVERYRQEPDTESWRTGFYHGSQAKLSGEQMTLRKHTRMPRLLVGDEWFIFKKQCL